MTNLTKHNQSMRGFFESADFGAFSSAVDLDTIDAVMRQYLSIEEMREAGSFFTGQQLATKAAHFPGCRIDANSVVLDPNCGAGNLLIECSRQLATRKLLSETLAIWGKTLWGFDVSHHFIEATKIRLAIEAVNRGCEIDCSLNDAFHLLPNIKVKNSLLVTKKSLESVTHTIMNPPFSLWPSPEKNYWKKGKINAAGIFLDKYLRSLPDNCHVNAILPDVLRSGSRYSDFRNFVSKNLQASCQVWGRFNSKTKVDVFILSGRISRDESGEIEWHKDLGNYKRLSDLYDVRTGPLVAYRDPEIGKSYPYFHPKNCPSWETVNVETETRKFTGTVIQPPVVLVKRTSSPSDSNRASATVIDLNALIAVENHMIVIKPKSGSISDCHELIKILRSKKTNDFLNDRARMRHLTVKVVKEIPIDI